MSELVLSRLHSVYTHDHHYTLVQDNLERELRILAEAEGVKVVSIVSTWTDETIVDPKTGGFLPAKRLKAVAEVER